MAATLGALLAIEHLELSLDPAVAVTPEALAASIRWVHSSDLIDPTPFLSDDVVLLTTGTQFASTSPDDVLAYVDRLVSRGVLALGFGTEVVRDGIPADLAAACSDRGLPLFEVPYRIPFIAVARANAEAIAAQAYERQDWSLAAQRALARAALRADGLEATIVELSRQLGAWVALYDSAGVRSFARGAAKPAGVDAEVAALQRRGSPVGASVTIDGAPVTLQTIGAQGRSGVLAIAGVTIDREARSVVNSVVAMIGLALAQGSAARHSDDRLRSAVAGLLESGDVAVARTVADAAWGRFPESPWVVAVADSFDTGRLAGSVFHGAIGDGVLVLAAAGSGVRASLERLGVRAGTAACGHSDALPRAIAEARAARGRGAASLVTDVADIDRDLVLELASPASVALASKLLAPLVAHDAGAGTDLVATLAAWLEADASNEVAATALGVHRHTVRARVTLAQQVLDLDLSGFAARANVWAALQLAGE